MLVRVLASTLIGIDALPVEVETDISQGLPSYTLIGLPGGSVREGADRIRAAIRNSGFPYPGRKITINLAPADLRKDGGLLDLPIALSILCAEGVVPAEALGRYIVAGELSLDGSLKPVRGVLPQALLAKALRLPGVIVPTANAGEADLVPGLDVVAAGSLRDAAAALSGETPRAPGKRPRANAAAALCRGDAAAAEGARARADAASAGQATAEATPVPDLRDVVGQAVARRILEIAAAGSHALLLVGPPGSGKTMLAERLPGILPDFGEGEALETAQIYSAAGEPPWPRLPTSRPFRAPHHTISPAGLVGGGTPPRPGEITFAHGGVLFLDEFSEFRRDAREALRQPLEAGEIRIARAAGVHRFPCRVLLVAAANPCPCGNHGHPRRICRCAPQVVARFGQRFSGPLLDRIDLSVTVPPMSGSDWSGARTGEGSDAVRARVAAARAIQAARYAGGAARTNGAARLPFAEVTAFLAPEAFAFLMRAADRMTLSGRAVGKVARVARTIADLAGEDRVGLPHVAEAIQYRLPEFTAGEGNAAPPAAAGR